jgi:monoamine oxidase
MTASPREDAERIAWGFAGINHDARSQACEHWALLHKPIYRGSVHNSVDVAVVGAGFGGLAAALDLHDAGLSVTVIEARERVGGRVFSVELENGEIAELGAEWIFAEDDALGATIERFGLVACEAGVDYLRREPRGEAAVPMSELDAFLQAADAHLATVDPAERSMGEVLDLVPGDDRARSVAKARLTGTFASDLSLVAWRPGWHAGKLAAEPAVYRRMERGNRSIADAAAHELPDVRLGWTAKSIRQGAGGVQVDASETIRADAAVVAVPVRLVTDLSFDPPVEADQWAAFEGLPMGVASKLAVPLDGEPAPCAIQCADLPFWFWVAEGPQGTRRVVTSFAGSEIPQGPLETATGDTGAWVRRIVELSPELRPSGTGVMKVWADDPWSRGAYSTWDGASLARRHVFERMHGAVAFAGEHTAGEHSGTMEGALRSGRRAAEQVLELLGRG